MRPGHYLLMQRLRGTTVGSNENLELFFLFLLGFVMEASSTCRTVGKLLGCGQANTIFSGIYKRGGCGGSSKSSVTS